MASSRPYSSVLFLVIAMLFIVTFSHVAETASQDVLTDAQRHHTRSHASSSARSVAQHAFAFLQASTATRKPALATTIGKPRRENPSAPD
ncbi:hypothetical protein F8388_000616 [Cannabis sativa]|uniref:Transmembrane protein n=1 Tax=Cannabis sativa TaxID=3483 RepID=A0A7J6GGF2_CANSA|nr:hypothetical protein G4B88_026375 [Cannabis sativa]KAF4381922.1 hypothetical protein F8388_000616 [Cannabis sativa]